MRTTLRLVVIVALMGGQPEPYRPIPFEPVDEAAKEPGLAAFREDVLRAVERRDIDALEDIASEAAASRVRSFGQMGQPPWRQIRQALSMGGAFTEARGAIKGRREFCAPYVYAAFPSELPHWIGGENLPWVITSARTRVHTGPSASSRVIEHVGHAIVEYLDHVPPSGGDRGWVLIALSPKTRGYVSAADGWSPLGWHVCMVRDSGQWRISALSSDEFSMQ